MNPSMISQLLVRRSESYIEIRVLLCSAPSSTLAGYLLFRPSLLVVGFVELLCQEVSFMEQLRYVLFTISTNLLS